MLPPILGQLAGTAVSSLVGSKLNPTEQSEQQPSATTPQAPMSIPLSGMDRVKETLGETAQGAFKQFANSQINRMTAKTDGQSQGEQAKAFADKMYPGTTPMDRLGGASGGTGNAQAMQSENNKIRVQTDMQKRELDTRERIAGLQAKTAISTAELAAQAPNRQASVSEAKVMSEISNLDAGTREKLASTAQKWQNARLTGNQADIAGIEKQFTSELQKAKIIQAGFGSPTAAGASVASKGAEAINAGLDKISDDNPAKDTIVTLGSIAGWLLGRRSSPKMPNTKANPEKHWKDTGIKKNHTYQK